MLSATVSWSLSNAWGVPVVAVGVGVAGVVAISVGVGVTVGVLIGVAVFGNLVAVGVTVRLPVAVGVAVNVTLLIVTVTELLLFAAFVSFAAVAAALLTNVVLSGRVEAVKPLTINMRLPFTASDGIVTVNRLVLAVNQDMASPPKSLEELGRADIQRIAIGIPEAVPAGRYAKGALEATGLWQRLASRMINTQNVRQALDYVARGEVDAGFVYATDAQLLSARVRVAFEVPTAEPIVYPIAVIKGGGGERLGQAFVAFVRTDEARSILRKYGFEPL